jgi:hypothetical protein
MPRHEQGSRLRFGVLPAPHEEVGHEHVTTAQLLHQPAHQRYLHCLPIQQWFLVPPAQDIK